MKPRKPKTGGTPNARGTARSGDRSSDRSGNGAANRTGRAPNRDTERPAKAFGKQSDSPSGSGAKPSFAKKSPDFRRDASSRDATRGPRGRRPQERAAGRSAERSAPFSFLACVMQPLPGLVKAFHRDLQATDFLLRTPTDLPEGSVIRVQPGPRPHRGPTPVELVAVVAPNSTGLESAIAIDNAQLPVDFSVEALAETQSLAPFVAGDAREDLRALPIVTIDGEDAKDFDDAVYAEPWREGTRERGWHLIVAIADVAYYVLPGSDLDRAAYQRGNSTYFPDQVVPMLPERLSNDLCSLRPREDRPVLAVHLYVDQKGQLRKHQFARAVIHSHARLTYAQVQAALDGTLDAALGQIIQPVLGAVQNLQAAAHVLLAARQRRHALELDLPEVRMTMADGGEIQNFALRERLFSHRLIEEFMILANVAAATALEARGQPCLYRCHAEPGLEKLQALKAVLKQHALKLSGGPTPTQMDFARVLQHAQIHPLKELIMRTILQSQMQAQYTPDNIGHYGLALPRYAHFTSPIRRYSDLIVHRHLIAALKLGEGGDISPQPRLKRAGEHLNVTERRSQQAEWDARDRILARFYQAAVGQEFMGRIISVQKFGCFVRVDQVAEGLLPLRLLGVEMFDYTEKTSKLKGRKSGKIYQIGLEIPVKLLESDLITGRLTFGLVASG